MQIAIYNFLRNLCGILRIYEKVEIDFIANKPQVDKVPEDGLGGDVLRCGGRHPWTPAHFHFITTVDNYEKATTYQFVKEDPYFQKVLPSP